MSQDPDKYLYFHVGLLKNSFALDALRQDALKYHMIDQPDQLIALRLTEYYELMAEGVLPPGIGVPLAVGVASGKRNGREEMTPTNSTASNDASPTTGQAGAYHSDEENIVTASPDAEQNADEAAEYWARL